MNDEDVPMEDEIIASTEFNNGPAAYAPEFVIPTDVFANPNIAHLPKNAQLPPLESSSIARPTSHYAESRSDKMDVARATPHRRTSPQVRIPPKPRSQALPIATLKTGLVYDPRMRFHAEIPNNSTIDDIHPEDPRRIHSIFEEIREAGLVRGPESSEIDDPDDHCWRIGIRPAEKHEILTIHTPEHYDFLTLEALKRDSIYFNHSTYDCARLAAGGAIEACKAVVQGSVRNAIAIIRPPGHHAESDSPSGFCIFNNVPIAARVCQDAYPQTCRKILILDWDVHHGNGIQHAFYRDPNVLYISLHVFRGGDFYPNLPDGNLTYCGEGDGIGKNVNIPWEEHGMGDAEYLYAFQEVVMPIAGEFDPDLVIISAGFDAAEGDVLGGCFVTPACYGHMTHMLSRLAKGKVVVCLEGGYNLRSIARSALAVTRVLMQEPPDRLSEDLQAPKATAVRVIEQVKRQHSKHWKCLYPKHLDRTDPGFAATDALHNVIRQWQSQRLALEHGMTPLPLQINYAGLSQTFEHNVIATPDFMERKPLLVILHDPPSFQDHPDPVTGRRELHNTWLTDVTKSYIDWAIENGFSIIDVNIPQFVAVESEESNLGFTKADDQKVRADKTREMANYLWTNYIEPNNATQVFFMGIGDAYLGLVDLLSRNETTTDESSRLELIIGFIADSAISSVKRINTDDDIGLWYHQHTKIFVKQSHYAFNRNLTKKLRKKLGDLQQSDWNTLDDMLVGHRQEVIDLLLEKKSEFTDTDANGLRGLPPVGVFSSPVPKSPRSPMGFGRSF
ncbi:putative histone deacetylase [Didymella exigua CBS 183.55]|uniref:Histone deacetylase n=1 Tax=Didymella exigua CBS 183.55 TaxID=1150837 RepID=A0A6A5RHG6_9PLEO|nr:putative histone deacetylase [Didymella exigua CBS 183.55]KAF1926568.1 putative histone deacetylase [Didymella exigua CBS 183.55]